MFSVFHHLQKGQTTQTISITMRSKERKDEKFQTQLQPSDNKSNHHHVKLGKKAQGSKRNFYKKSHE